MLRNHFKHLIYLFVLTASFHAQADPLVNLFRAINIDNVSTVRALLAEGVDPNATNPKGQVALTVAISDGSPKVVAALLAHPAIQVDATNTANETPLMMAALRGDLTSVQALLARGAAVNRPGWTPLHYAASGPDNGVAAWLLERGAELEAQSPNRSTPLMMASRYGPETLADTLLARGASTKARNDAGLDAAAFARLAGREALAARLQAASR